MQGTPPPPQYAGHHEVTNLIHSVSEVSDIGKLFRFILIFRNANNGYHPIRVCDTVQGSATGFWNAALARSKVKHS